MGSPTDGVASALRVTKSAPTDAELATASASRVRGISWMAASEPMSAAVWTSRFSDQAEAASTAMAAKPIITNISRSGEDENGAAFAIASCE